MTITIIIIIITFKKINANIDEDYRSEYSYNRKKSNKIKQ